MAGTSIKSIIFGFIAGAIATVTVHELIKYALLEGDVLTGVPLPWSTDPVGPWALPQIANDALWGGLWGVILALILGDPPRGSMTFKGIVLGLLGPALIGVYVLRPLLVGQSDLFFGGDFGQIGSIALILAGWGAFAAWLYGFFSYGCRLP